MSEDSMKQLFVDNLIERVKVLEDALKWYADSGNYLAATNENEGTINADTTLATAYAHKRIEIKAKQALQS